jgi:hypothetical protein
MAVGVIAAVGGGGGLAYRFARDHADQAIHRVVDTQLPERVKEHPWAPVVGGHAVRRDAISFDGGTVDTTRCHVALGTYGLTIVKGFTFTASTTRIPRGCPGTLVRRTLARASHVSDSTDGTRTTLTFTDGSHTVLTLRGVRP